MKLFLDTAKIEEIKYGLEVWDIDGVTTNPKHVQASGKSSRAVMEEIAPLFEGTDKAVSVEVDPHLTDPEKIFQQGVELSKLSPNFVVKVGVSEPGLKAIRALTNHGVLVNATLVFSVAQAWHAARAGAAYVSPFVGWKEQYGDDARKFITEVRQMLDTHGYEAEIIAAALRNARQLGEAAIAGAHCVTAGAQVYKDSFDNPYTTYGEAVFQAAWDATPKD